MSKAFLFLDPGYDSGAMAVIAPGNTIVADLNIKENFIGTVSLVSQTIQSLRDLGYEVVGAIEKVSASPKQGAVSAFNFGQGFGALKALLAVWQVQYHLVPPAKWQEIIDAGVRKTPRLRKDSDLLDAKSADKAYRERLAGVKAASWDFAKRMFPQVELKTKNAHQDRADALCGAYWLSKQP